MQLAAVAFEDVVSIGFAAGVAMIVIGALLLAVAPGFGGFGARGEGFAAPDTGLAAVLKPIGEAFTKFLAVVINMVSSKRKYRPGQYLIATGFLLVLVCGLLWIAAQVAEGDGGDGGTTTTGPTSTQTAP